VRLLAAIAASVSLATPTTFLQSHQQPDGGFSEEGGTPSPALAAWASLGLAARGADTGHARDYLVAHAPDVNEPATKALVAMAAASLGDERLVDRLAMPPPLRQTNAVIWTILALRQASRVVPSELVGTLLLRQEPSGGWSWAKGVAADSNDTAAAVQALRSAGVRGAPIRRALAYLERFHRKDGGFALTSASASDAQSTAWAIQAFLAAGRAPPRGSLAYLQTLRQPDGSYRLSKRYATTPVWVTSQVLPAVAKRPFPLRPVRG
jgi:hypothetical protein